MNNYMQRLTAFLIVFFLSCTTHAAELSNSSLYKLMSLSGINTQFKEIPQLITASLDESRQQDNTPISDEQYDDLRKAIIRSFQVSEFLDVVGKAIKQDISEKEARVLLKWYRSKPGKKITRAEEAASTAEAYQEMMAQAESLLANEERLNLAKKMDELLNTTQMTFEIQNNVALTSFVAISTALNPSQAAPVEEFKKQLSAQEAQMKQELNQFVVLSFVYSYRNINTSELEQYIQFLQKPEAMKFNLTALKALGGAFTRAAETLSTHLAFYAKKHSQ